MHGSHYGHVTNRLLGLIWVCIVCLAYYADLVLEISNCMQQTASAEGIFSHIFLGRTRVTIQVPKLNIPKIFLLLFYEST